MAIQILKPAARENEKRIGRYMREIRDIVQGGFNRRELLTMGLVMGGAGLAAMQGMRAFRPYWAHADDGGGGIRLTSPPNTPFVDPLPIPAVMQKTSLDPAPTQGSNPVASALTGFTETNRPAHQRWTQFGGASDTAPGFTGAMYEVLELPVQHDFYPPVDKMVLIGFMHTACAENCPLANANLLQVQRAMASRVGRDFFMYSITVDPEHDTPEVLREYATRLGVQPGWLFLTGTEQDIQALRRFFGDEPGGDFRKSQHLNLLSFGIEPLERWGGCPSLINPKWIVRYLSWLDPKGERPTGWWPPGHAVPGEERKSAGDQW